MDSAFSHSKNNCCLNTLRACSALAAIEHVKWHNAVASLHICELHARGFGIHTPQPVVLNSGDKILWDLDIRADCIISA